MRIAIIDHREWTYSELLDGGKGSDCRMRDLLERYHSNGSSTGPAHASVNEEFVEFWSAAMGHETREFPPVGPPVMIDEG